MKSTPKRVKLDKTKLFGFNQTSSGKPGTRNEFTRPMIGGKTTGVKTVA